jgi:hypothetical protein
VAGCRPAANAAARAIARALDTPPPRFLADLDDEQLRRMAEHLVLVRAQVERGRPKAKDVS